MPLTPTGEANLIEETLGEITDTLQAKRKTWTAEAPLFDNFDVMRDFDLDPIRMGLVMCRLKMNRLKSVWAKCGGAAGMATDADAQDTIKDLACYAILTMAMMKRDAAQYPGASRVEPPDEELVKIFTERHVNSPQGREEIRKLAEEMMGEPIPPQHANLTEMQRIANEIRAGTRTFPSCSNVSPPRGFSLPRPGDSIKASHIRNIVNTLGDRPNEARIPTQRAGDTGRDDPGTLPDQHYGGVPSHVPGAGPLSYGRSHAGDSLGRRYRREGDFFRDIERQAGAAVDDS